MGAVVPPRRILRRCARRFRTAVSAVPRIAPEVPRFVHHKRNGDAQNPDQETGYLRSGLRFASCPDRKSASPSRLDRKSTRRTPVTNAHLVCRLLLEKKKKKNK